MIAACSIDPAGIYDEGSLCLALGVTPNALACARRSGQLRFTRKGRRVLFVGQWVIDWLRAEDREEAVEQRPSRMRA